MKLPIAKHTYTKGFHLTKLTCSLPKHIGTSDLKESQLFQLTFCLMNWKLLSLASQMEAWLKRAWLLAIPWL